MRDLELVALECMEMLDAIGISYGNIKEIVPNTRAKSRWGQCKRIAGSKDFTININVDLLDERNSIDGLKNTIIHELLHSVNGCMNHGEEWKKQARRVYEAYGINIQRCSSSEEKGVAYRREKVVKKHTNAVVYLIECECCHHMYKRYKMSKVVKNPERYRCGKCNGTLKRIS